MLPSADGTNLPAAGRQVLRDIQSRIEKIDREEHSKRESIELENLGDATKTTHKDNDDSEESEIKPASCVSDPGKGQLIIRIACVYLLFI